MSLFKNRYLVLSPILIIYSVVILIINRVEPVGDGYRYWKYAENLLNGFFANPDLKPGFLWSGPGYPIFLIPFKLLETAIIIPTMGNAVLIYLGSIFFSKSISTFLNFDKSILITFILIIINIPLLIYSTYLYTEPLTFFLINLLIWRIINHKNTIKSIIFLSGIISFIILTKIIFAYVFLGIIILISILKLNKNICFENNFFKTYIFIIIFCLPYQIYTYDLTNKFFYWGDSGGELLYYLSSPHEEDLAQWHEGNSDFLKNTITEKYHNLNPVMINKVNDIIFENRKKNHGAFLESLSNLNGVERNNQLTNAAIKNISNNKLIFVKNWIINTSRLFIGYPYSLYFKPPNTPIKMVFNIILSSAVFLCFIGSLILYLIDFKKYNFNIHLIIFICVIYLFGSSLLATQSQRFLIPISPMILFITALVINDKVKIKLK